MDNNEMNNSGVGENSSDVNATVDSQYTETTQDTGYTAGDYKSYTYTAPDAGSFNGVEEPKKGIGIAALILGIVSLIAWCLPFMGYPVTIAGLVLGIIGIKKSVKGMSVAGTVMSGIGLVITIINSILGVMYAVNNMNY